jgi:phosphoribosylformimino-5-aminoimidazole carboxamide ribotide isomerase
VTTEIYSGYICRMTKFRPCIDLHSGQVKQIVGGTLTTASADLKTNYVSKLPASYFAKLYKDNGLDGAHVIMLGPGNEEAAKEALSEWKGGLQVGGGINDRNAKQWIDLGAEKVHPVLTVAPHYYSHKHTYTSVRSS